MSDPRDYKVEISGLGSTPGSEESTAASQRPFLSVRFDCCHVYTRIYQSKDGKSYSGACPKCGKRVNFAVGEGGTDSRFFVVK
jgi:hypothetical protein